MERLRVLRLMSFVCAVCVLSAGGAVVPEDGWKFRLVSPDRPIVRCSFQGTKDSRAILRAVRTIYGDYTPDTVELDAATLPWGAPRKGEVILYLAEPKAEGQPSLYTGYYWRNVDADEKEAARVICAGEHMAPLCDTDTLVMYFMNLPPNLAVRATLARTDDEASYWKISKVLLPAPAPRSVEGLRSLGYLDSPKPAFPPPSAAPIPVSGESIVVRLDAWTRRAETMVRYSDPEKPAPPSADAVAAGFKELASKELTPGREAVLLLTDSGRLGDQPAYNAVVVIPSPSATRGEVDKAEKVVLEAADVYRRLKPL